jgi:hypothetical protein
MYLRSTINANVQIFFLEFFLIIKQLIILRNSILWEQELFTLLEHMSSPRFLVVFVLLNLYFSV